MINFDDSLKIANKIVSFFNGKIIGSTLLLELGLDKGLINDIDVLVNPSELFIIKEYLADNDYVETKHSYRQKGYNDTIGSLLFEKVLHTPIHLSLRNKDIKVMEKYELIAEKFKRLNDSDQVQLLYLIHNRDVKNKNS